jgi:glucosamine-phosphate N-acetyltransferase
MIPDIREAELSDFDEVIELLEQLWPGKELSRSALMKVFSACIESPDNFYLCTEVDGKVIGFCSLGIKESLWMEGLVGHINELIVDKSFRRIGIGTELIEAAIAVAKEKGCKRVELDSAFYRDDAHKFYSKKGFINRAYLCSKEL